MPDHFCGTWYYYSGGFVEGKPAPIRECRFEIRRGFFVPYVGNAYTPHTNQTPRFKSLITREAGRLIENFKTADGKSTGYCSFPEPAEGTRKLFGFWVSSNVGDVHRLLSCGLIVFSKDRIPPTDLVREFREGYEFFGEVPLMIRLRANEEVRKEPSRILMP
jgi:hypothetical protein